MYITTLTSSFFDINNNQPIDQSNIHRTMTKKTRTTNKSLRIIVLHRIIRFKLAQRESARLETTKKARIIG